MTQATRVLPCGSGELRARAATETGRTHRRDGTDTVKPTKFLGSRTWSTDGQPVVLHETERFTVGSAVCQRRTAMVGGEIKRFGHSADSGVKCGLATGNSLSTLGQRADAAGPVPTASPLMRITSRYRTPRDILRTVHTTKGKMGLQWATNSMDGEKTSGVGLRGLRRQIPGGDCRAPLV